MRYNIECCILHCWATICIAAKKVRKKLTFKSVIAIRPLFLCTKSYESFLFVRKSYNKSYFVRKVLNHFFPAVGCWHSVLLFVSYTVPYMYIEKNNDIALGLSKRNIAISVVLDF